MRKTKKVGIPFRTLLALLSVALLFGGAIGGTFAWLTSTPDPVTNTFTVGDIDIELKESPLKLDGTLEYPQPTADNWSRWTYGIAYKFVPGVDLNKNPTVKVLANSETCYLFVKVEEDNWPTDNVTYNIDAGQNWQKLTGVDGVWYQVVESSTADKYISILTGNMVDVDENLSADDLSGTATLKFTAYAIQKAGFNDEVTVAWNAALAAAANP